jgi:tRNA C32,U32 (ribose-2'-O)-methylase TrmJ
MKNMGSPRPPRAAGGIRRRAPRGIAHGTTDVIERIAHFDSFDEGGRLLAWSLTARRAAKMRVIDPKARRRNCSMWSPMDVGMVFGREDSGLPNEILDRVHAP